MSWLTASDRPSRSALRQVVDRRRVVVQVDGRSHSPILAWGCTEERIMMA